METERALFELFAGPFLGITAEMVAQMMPALQRALWSLAVFVCVPWVGLAIAFFRDTERGLVLSTSILGGLGAALSYWIYSDYFVWTPFLRSVASGLIYGAVLGIVPWTFIVLLKYLGRRSAYEPGSV